MIEQNFIKWLLNCTIPGNMVQIKMCVSGTSGVVQCLACIAI